MQLAIGTRRQLSARVDALEMHSLGSMARFLLRGCDTAASLCIMAGPDMESNATPDRSFSVLDNLFFAGLVQAVCTLLVSCDVCCSAS